VSKLIDQRVPDYDNRRKFFKQYYHWQLKTEDCDPAMFLLNYIFRRLELNSEQRYWISFLYANTYQLPTAWIMANEFPDFEKVDVDRLTNWNKENLKELKYQVDNKWQKGHLPAMFISYRDNVLKTGNQEQFFLSLCQEDTEQKNFEVVSKYIIKNFYKMGRYIMWFYLQTLRETCDLPVLPTSLLLKDKSSSSHAKGLLFALGMDDVANEKELNFDQDVWDFLDEEAASILQEMKEEYPDVKVDYFTMETSLCSFKKIFRESHGRYLGYYLDRQAEDIYVCQNNKRWRGIDWDLLHDGREQFIDKRLINKEVNKDIFGELGRTGTIRYINWFK